MPADPSKLICSAGTDDATLIEPVTFETTVGSLTNI
jgi:hypothetical protein